MKTVFLATTMMLAGTAAGVAQQWPRPCLRNVQVPRSELGPGFKVLGMLFMEGGKPAEWQHVDRMSLGEWTSCRCFKSTGLCDCCDVDVPKFCASVEEHNRVTHDRSYFGACKPEPS